MATEAGVPLLGGASLKAALDRDWDDPVARDQALGVVLEALEQVEGFVADQQLASPGVGGRLGRPGRSARTCSLPTRGRQRFAKGSLGIGGSPSRTPQMRHGRKSRSHLIDGYKRHVLRDLDSGLVPAVGLTPANLPEAQGAEQIRDDLAAQQLTLAELFIDRAYLSSTWSQTVPMTFRSSARPGGSKTAPGSPRPTSPSTSTAAFWSAPPASRWRSPLAARSSSPQGSAPPVPCASSAPPAPADAACRSTPTSNCWPSCAPASSPPRGAPSCASGWRSSTPWPTLATGRTAAPATWATARTCSTCAAAPWCTTCTSSPVRPRQPSRP